MNKKGSVNVLYANGISFTKQQEERIKKLRDAGDTKGQRKYILELLDEALKNGG